MSRHFWSSQTTRREEVSSVRIGKSADNWARFEIMHGRAWQRRKVVSPRRCCEAGNSSIRRSPACRESSILGTWYTAHNHKLSRNSNKRSGGRYRTVAPFGAFRFFGRWTRMAEPERDHRDADSGLEQVHGDRVIQSRFRRPTGKHLGSDMTALLGVYRHRRRSKNYSRCLAGHRCRKCWNLLLAVVQRGRIRA